MNIDYEKQVGMKIRDLRIKNNMTQEQLSAKLQVLGCDITRSALAKIEVGQRHLYPDEIKALKEILKVKYEDIFI
ncbi:MAG: helix-turn-helix transcriptional regulator [Clostridia bacterium]|jgi:transcriptional regulator with XRE-family HTH domain|nr:helix-turn-helix transcriptional regulator [Clostridia bacterium]